MPLEIERKFLLKNLNWKEDADQGTSIKQGYLNSQPERTVRIRIYGKKGFLTIKGKTVKSTRQEFEYEIPLEEALELLDLCEKPMIEKTRFIVKANGKLWEVEIFEGHNKGLTLAEVELKSEDESIEIPEWVAQEVTHDVRYYNSNLIKNPFGNW